MDLIDLGFPFFRESITQYRKQIFILLFQRLQSSKTTKFIKSLYNHLTTNLLLLYDNVSQRAFEC